MEREQTTKSPVTDNDAKAADAIRAQNPKFKRRPTSAKEKAHNAPKPRQITVVFVLGRKGRVSI